MTDLEVLTRWFGELEEGDRFQSRGRTVTEADVVQFAALTGDMHPQHTDRHWSAEGRFGGRVAHGMLVLSYAMGLVPFDPERVVALRGLDRVSFKRPVQLGDTISVTGAVAELTELDEGHGMVGVDLRVRNHRDELVARARVNAVWRMEPDTEGDDADADQPESFTPIPL
jgi:3-hydroxybutyryl-CoA dehydratase